MLGGNGVENEIKAVRVLRHFLFILGNDDVVGAKLFAVVDLARRFEDAGVAALLFTDIGRDGMLKGVNVEATAARELRKPYRPGGPLAILFMG